VVRAIRRAALERGAGEFSLLMMGTPFAWAFLSRRIVSVGPVLLWVFFLFPSGWGGVAYWGFSVSDRDHLGWPRDGRGERRVFFYFCTPGSSPSPGMGLRGEIRGQVGNTRQGGKENKKSDQKDEG